MSHPIADYDVALSVTARRILTLEQHSLQECFTYVFGPTATLLGEYADKQKPRKLTCMHSLAYQKALGITSHYAEIDLVLPGARTLYLAHVFGRDEANILWGQLKETYAADQGEPCENPRGYFVPSKDRVVTHYSCERAIKTYCEHQCPQLAHLPITWLDDATAVELYTFIWDTARLSERPPA